MIGTISLDSGVNVTTESDSFRSHGGDQVTHLRVIATLSDRMQFRHRTPHDAEGGWIRVERLLRIRLGPLVKILHGGDVRIRNHDTLEGHRAGVCPGHGEKIQRLMNVEPLEIGRISSRRQIHADNGIGVVPRSTHHQQHHVGDIPRRHPVERPRDRPPTVHPLSNGVGGSGPPKVSESNRAHIRSIREPR